MNNKWVIFDSMGVIFLDRDDIKDLFIPFLQKKAGLKKIDTEKIIDLYKEKASRGKMLSTEFIMQSGICGNLVELEKEYLDTNIKLDPQFIECVVSLRKRGFKIALISNDIKEWSNYIRKKHKIEKYFDFVLISGECGYRKPEHDIYNLFIEKNQVSPTDCVLIDDNMDNLAAADQLNFKCIYFDKMDIEDNKYKTASSFNNLDKIIDSL